MAPSPGTLIRVLTDSRKEGHIVCVSSTHDYAEQLRTADLRVTRPRVAVLEAVHAHPHADTETLFGAVRAGLPEVSRQAVYDVLAALTAVGLVRRIQPSGSVARYEAQPKGSPVPTNVHDFMDKELGKAIRTASTTSPPTPDGCRWAPNTTPRRSPWRRCAAGGTPSDGAATRTPTTVDLRGRRRLQRLPTPRLEGRAVAP